MNRDAGRSPEALAGGRGDGVVRRASESGTGVAEVGHVDAPGRAVLIRRIIALAVPAFGALVAEPLFLLVDTGVVGHLGATPLAGLGLASTVLQTVVGLCVFLAYATTPRVARRLGAGDKPGAVRAGIEGMWLSLITGAVLAVAAWLLAPIIPTWFGGEAGMQAEAARYLAVSAIGLPAMLLTLGATGLLRGLQDTVTPLVVSIAGFVANAALNAWFVLGLGLGIAGSALGTVVAQWAMALVYGVVAMRAARRTGASLAPGVGPVRRVVEDSTLMLIRTGSLRVVLIALVAVGATAGVPELAAIHITLTMFSLMAFALDSLAIAGQTLIGHELGAERLAEVRRITTVLCWMGVVAGLVCGLVGVMLSGALGGILTDNGAVRALLPAAFTVLALAAPISGYVFVLDGVLIGAGDLRYLAFAGLIPMVASLLGFGAVSLIGRPGGPVDLHGVGGVVAIWAVFGLCFLGMRAVVLGLRARSDAWMRVESSPRE